MEVLECDLCDTGREAHWCIWCGVYGKRVCVEGGDWSRTCRKRA
jgi:hypothetical protein